MALAETAKRDLRAARSTLDGTLLEPLLGQVADNLTAALNGASFTSEAIIRHTAEETRLIIPEARLRSGTGEIILALSQINWGLGAGPSEASGGRGNFITSGRGLPRLNGRIADQGEGGFSMRLAMADYIAGDSRLAIPRLILEQRGSDQGAGGAYRFSGLVTASGALPGGQISGLELPLEGGWSNAAGLTVGQRCATVRFEALRLAQLDLAGRQIALCPADGRAMLRYDKALQLDVLTSRVALAGTLGGSPAQISADRAAIRYPGPFAIEGVDLQLGDAGSSGQTRLELASVSGRLEDIAQGEFSGGKALMGDLTFVLSDMAGRWAFSDGGLAIEDAGFTLIDRAPGQPRFEPLSGRSAYLRTDGDDVSALAQLHHPPSGQKVASVALRHNLASAAGRADILVEKLTFGPSLDAENLSYLAKGVVAFAKGAVSGQGQVESVGDKVTSDGRFRSDGLDFAAAFGPVRGLKGEVRFTDLLALTTAPDQKLEIAAVNTGVEVLDGRLTFSLTNGQMITISDARWPFMDGQLVLRPVVLDFTKPSEKRYVFDISGLDAATFVAEMELTNLSVSGTFDGTVPIVFDSSGNGRVENGLLRARAPGGNVAYIGELTYEDMGVMANYAFRALRSLDYRDMSVVLDGSLTGEIISKFDFDGVRQGAGTSQNFITRRLARLPILFRVNVKAESFYELSTVVRSFFDASMLGNPMDRGLLRLENGRIVPAIPSQQSPSDTPSLPQGDAAATKPAANRPEDVFVQPPESDNRP